MFEGFKRFALDAVTPSTSYSLTKIMFNNITSLRQIKLKHGKELYMEQ